MPTSSDKASESVPLTALSNTALRSSVSHHFFSSIVLPAYKDNPGYIPAHNPETVEPPRSKITLKKANRISLAMAQVPSKVWGEFRIETSSKVTKKSMTLSATTSGVKSILAFMIC